MRVFSFSSKQKKEAMFKTYKKALLILILIPLLISSPITKVEAESIPSEPIQSMKIEGKEMDVRAIILRDYLATHNSPLQHNAQDFIDAADIYGVDWKLVPAISGVESTFGKHIPGGYNGWGWGVYGDQAIYFKSWREAIFIITKGLKNGYINKGLVTPTQMNRIYASSPHWGRNVNFFLSEIEEFSKDYKSRDELLVKHKNIETQTVRTSAKLNTALSNSMLNLAFGN